MVYGQRGELRETGVRTHTQFNGRTQLRRNEERRLWMMRYMRIKLQQFRLKCLTIICVAACAVQRRAGHRHENRHENRLENVEPILTRRAIPHRPFFVAMRVRCVKPSECVCGVYVRGTKRLH